jgi:Ca-activated chloride channel family protein
VLDYLAISRPGAAPKEYLKRDYASSGNPLRLDLPEEVGGFEIRYLQGQTNTVLATRLIETQPVTATRDAPAALLAGARVEVTWTGPGNRLDFIAISRPAAPPEEYSKRNYVSSGNPVRIGLPDEPGLYEIRYQQGQSRNVLSRRAIEVLAASDSEP